MKIYFWHHLSIKVNYLQKLTFIVRLCCMPGWMWQSTLCQWRSNRLKKKEKKKKKPQQLHMSSQSWNKPLKDALRQGSRWTTCPIMATNQKAPDAGSHCAQVCCVSVFCASQEMFPGWENELWEFHYCYQCLTYQLREFWLLFHGFYFFKYINAVHQ